jgi:hypothetical protein
MESFCLRRTPKFLFKPAIQSREKKRFLSFTEAHGANAATSNWKELFRKKDLREE